MFPFVFVVVSLFFVRFVDDSWGSRGFSCVSVGVSWVVAWRSWEFRLFSGMFRGRCVGFRGGFVNFRMVSIGVSWVFLCVWVGAS